MNALGNKNGNQDHLYVCVFVYVCIYIYVCMYIRGGKEKLIENAFRNRLWIGSWYIKGSSLVETEAGGGEQDIVRSDAKEKTMRKTEGESQEED